MIAKTITGSRLVCLLLLGFALLSVLAMFSFADAETSSLLHGKEGWSWGKKVGGEGKHGHAHGYGEVHADPKVGHSWKHGLDVKGGYGHHGHGYGHHGHGHHGHGYGSGYVKVVKLVRRNEGHGNH